LDEPVGKKRGKFEPAREMQKNAREIQESRKLKKAREIQKSAGNLKLRGKCKQGREIFFNSQHHYFNIAYMG
jgi:hypothetical protein